MPRKVYYGSYQSQRNKSNRKKAAAITLSVLGITVFIVAVCIVSFNKNGYGAAMQQSVEEMTQMRIKIKELEDENIVLRNELEACKAELALRPASTAVPIEPPNDAVATMQATPEPTPEPTKKPRSTKKPQLPTQPPVQPQTVQPEPVAPQQPQPEPPAAEPVQPQTPAEPQE